MFKNQFKEKKQNLKILRSFEEFNEKDKQLKFENYLNKMSSDSLNVNNLLFKNNSLVIDQEADGIYKIDDYESQKSNINNISNTFYQQNQTINSVMILD